MNRAPEVAPLETETPTRETLCLNGLWDFFPQIQETDTPPSDGWGTIWVPGGWRNFISWIPMPQIETRGAWPEYDTETLTAGWYRRAFSVPEGWKDRAVVLTTSRAVRAEVYVDRAFCGRFDALHDEVDLTGFCPEGTGELQLLVQEGPGLFGDVFLKSRPREVFIEDVFVQTSVRRRKLGLSVTVSPRWPDVELNLTAVLMDGSLHEAKRFGSILPKGRSGQTFAIEWDWLDPRFWDVGLPHLYTLYLMLDGHGCHDVYRQEFGFREFWIEGKKFFLNGTELHLRPVMTSEVGNIEIIDATIDGYVASGYNFGEMWPGKEVDAIWRTWYDRADRKGFLVSGGLVNQWEFLSEWNNDETKQAFEKRIQSEIRRIRNHPSIVMWGTSANAFGSGLGMDPRTIGVKKDHWFEHFYWRKRRASAGEEGVALIKKHDSTRPVFTHHGGGVGDVYTLNMYLNLIPLQEREEWLTDWIAKDTMPFMVVEFGTPLHVTFNRGRTDFPGAVVTEPWMTEFCAIYLGQRAFDLEQDAYRDDIVAYFRGKQEYRNWQTNPHFDFAPALQELLALFDRNTWRSWRTMGMTGGMVPWNDGHGWERTVRSDEVVPLGGFTPGRRGWYLKETQKWHLYRNRPEGCTVHPAGWALTQNNGPTLAWIAGAPSCFTAKDHHFGAGSSVEKQAALINDLRTEAPYTLRWQVSLRGKILVSAHQDGTLNPGQILFVPFHFQLPALGASERAEGNILLEASIGGHAHRDEFSFTAFAPTSVPSRQMAVFDPSGDTSDFLRGIGYTLVGWDGKPSHLPLVVGRNALAQGAALPGAMEAHVRAGGTLLVFAQDPEWMRTHWGFRVGHQISRRIFPLVGETGFGGLSAEDLRDWNGESTLIEPRPKYTPANARLAKWWFPYHGYHWGNRGGVSSAPVEKPHCSSWRPLLECEFDLAYTPLMEMDFGRGRVLLTTLDIEDHASLDPAAHRAGVATVEEAFQEREEGKVERVRLWGTDEDAQFLSGLGVVFQKGNPGDWACDLLIVGPQVVYDPPELNSFLRQGGRAFFLAGRTRFPGLNLKTTLQPGFAGSRNLPTWAELRGLSRSDLRFKTAVTQSVFSDGSEVAADGLFARHRLGKGVALFCTLDPRTLAADTKTYFRLTRWRHTRAICQVLSNLGAAFVADQRFFSSQPEPEVGLSQGWVGKILETCRTEIDRARDSAAIAEQCRNAGGATLVTNFPRTWENFPADWVDNPHDVMFKKQVSLPPTWEGRGLLLFLGKVDGNEVLFFNGAAVDYGDPVPPAPHNYPRVYRIPASLVAVGSNELVVYLYGREQRFDAMGGGGFCGPASQMRLVLEPQPGDGGLYHPDYRADYVYGDDPYRYFNW